MVQEERPGLFQGERLLVGVGLLGIALSGAIAVWILLRGNALIPPEGELADVRDFMFAVGVFTITLAAMLPLAGFSQRGRRRFRWWITGLTVYFYGAELVPTLFGQDPRFSPEPVFAVFGGIFGIGSLVLSTLYVIFTVALFRSRVSRQTLLMGARYGMLAALVAVFGGVLMGTVFSGREVGNAGNLLVSHAVGFHGLQAVPLVAWLLERSNLSFGVAQRWAHLAGGSWLAFAVLTFTQAVLGHGPMDAGLVLYLSIAFAGVWLLALAFSSVAWARSRSVSVATAPTG